MMSKFILTLSLAALCVSSVWAQNGAPNVAPQATPMPGPAPVVGQPYFNGGNQCNSCDAGNACCEPCLDCCNYLRLFGGWTELEDFETFNQQTQVTGTFDNGYGLGLALGRKIRPMINVECEFAYRHNDTDELTANFLAQAPIATTWDGGVDTYAGMTNFLLEGCRRIGRVTPYGGAGAGFGFVNAGVSSQFGDYTVDDSGWAYQFIAGVSRACSCRADAFVEYRYFAIEDNDVQNSSGATVDEFDYRTHNIFFGLRFCH